MVTSGNGFALSPSLWRTCRALANRRRLRLFRHVLEHPDSTLSQIAAQTGLTVPVASQYLRALNARGLLAARRASRWVHYRVEPDPSVPESAAIASALASHCRGGRQAAESAFRVLTAFTHPRRVFIVGWLYRTNAAEPAELASRGGMSRHALWRHLTKLERRGLVTRDGAVCRLTPAPNGLAAALIRIAGSKER